MVTPEQLRERELERTLETYEYLLKKRDDIVSTQRFVIFALVILLTGVIVAMATQC